MAHKTFSGMAKAVESLIVELQEPFDPTRADSDYRLMRRKAESVFRELDAAWANDAQAADAAKLANRLREACELLPL